MIRIKALFALIRNRLGGNDHSHVLKEREELRAQREDARRLARLASAEYMDRLMSGMLSEVKRGR